MLSCPLQNVTVVYPTWLDDCVKKQRRIDPRERHPELGYCHYVVPVLPMETVCTTGFNLRDRDVIEAKVELLGGRYAYDMEEETCTLLIAKKAAGNKYDLACRKSIPVVNRLWLNECIARCLRVDPCDFSLPESANLSQQGQGDDCRELVSQPPSQLSGSLRSQETSTSSPMTISFGITISEPADYLEDRKIFLAGDIQGSERKELLRLCRAGRATSISADPTGLPKSRGITHIVSGKHELSDDLVDVQQFCDLCPPCVHADWLRQCASERQYVNTESYLIVKAPNVVFPPQHKLGAGFKGKRMFNKSLSVHTAHLGDVVGERVPSSVPTTLDREGSVRNAPLSLGNRDRFLQDDGIMQPDSATLIRSIGTLPGERTSDSPGAQVTAPDSNGSGGSSKPASDHRKIFDGATFTLHGLLSEDTVELKRMITDAGGSVVAANNSSSDFEVKPLGDAMTAQTQAAEAPPTTQTTFGCRVLPRLSSGKHTTVSEYWVRKCCAMEKLLPPRGHKIYAPLGRSLAIDGDHNLEVCLSGMNKASKQLVHWLADRCGVKIQPQLSKKTTSHLLACMPVDGPSEKMLKAKQWKVKVTSLAWLEECAVTGGVLGDVRAYPPGQELDHVPSIRPAPGEVTSTQDAAACVTKEDRRLDTSIQVQESCAAPTKRPWIVPLTLKAPETFPVKSATGNNVGVNRGIDGGARILSQNFSQVKRKSHSVLDMLAASGMYKINKPTSSKIAPGNGSELIQAAPHRSTQASTFSEIAAHRLTESSANQGSSNNEKSTNGQDSRAVFEQELAQVLQNLPQVARRLAPVPVKRRRAVCEDDANPKTSGHLSSPNSVLKCLPNDGLGKTSFGQGYANRRRDLNSDNTPRTIARGGNKRRRGEQVERYSSDEDQEYGDFVSDDDDEQTEVRNATAQKGQEKLEEFMNRLRTRAKAAKESGAGNAVHNASAAQDNLAQEPAPIALLRRSSRGRGQS